MPYTIIGFGNGYNRVDGPRSSVAPLDDATVSADDYHQEVVVKVGEHRQRDPRRHRRLPRRHRPGS